MVTPLPALPTQRLSGTESFHGAGAEDQFNVLAFWQWSYSALGANNLRGHLAEFLVARALDSDGGVRMEWDSCDIRTWDHIRVEVKSAAYIQAWEQDRASDISFGIAPSKGWDAMKRRRGTKKLRNSDVYVFCILETRDQRAFDPTDLDEWRFHVLATKTLNNRLGAQKTLSLGRLLSLEPTTCSFSELPSAVRSTVER